MSASPPSQSNDGGEVCTELQPHTRVSTTSTLSTVMEPLLPESAPAVDESVGCAISSARTTGSTKTF